MTENFDRSVRRALSIVLEHSPEIGRAPQSIISRLDGPKPAGAAHSSPPVRVRLTETRGRGHATNRPRAHPSRPPRRRARLAGSFAVAAATIAGMLIVGRGLIAPGPLSDTSSTDHITLTIDAAVGNSSGPSDTTGPTLATTRSRDATETTLGPASIETAFTAPSVETRIVVVNASTVDGAASNLAAALPPGYTNSPPALGFVNYWRTVVYYSNGSEQQADRLAHELGATIVRPLNGTERLAQQPLPDVDLVLVLGNDLATQWDPNPTSGDAAPRQPIALAIGDSGMMFAAPELALSGAEDIELDASTFRQVDDPLIVAALAARRAADSLAEVVVIHLGSNGPASSESYEALMAQLLDRRAVIFVTISPLVAWADANNELIRALPQHFANVRIFDWAALPESAIPTMNLADAPPVDADAARQVDAARQAYVDGLLDMINTAERA